MHPFWQSNFGCAQFASGLRVGSCMSVWVLCVCGGYASSVQAAGETLEVRNTSPIAQLYGLPTMRGGRADELQVRFSVDAANSFTGDFTDSEFVFLDGETAVFSYAVSRGFGKRWEAGVEVPWIVHSGGRFDGLIDEFHDLFGFPDGGRPLADRGELDYVISADGELATDIRSKKSDLGDLRGWLGWSLLESGRRSLVARAHTKLPTGRAQNLSGSGGFDGALSLDFIQRSALPRASVQMSLGGGLAFLGQGDLLPSRQRTVVPFGHFGLGIGLGERLTLLGQLDAHGALFNAELSHLGNAVLQGTLGLKFAFSSKLAVDLSLVEDLSGAQAADVIFKLGLVGRFD